MTLYFLGGGNMATAIISGLRTQYPDMAIHVANRGAAKREQLAQTHQVAVSEQLPPLTAEDILVLAVKPQDMHTACSGLETNGALVLSVAAGLSVDTLSSYLGGTRRIIRIMPNTPSQVGLGMAGLYAHAAISETDKQMAQRIMQASGEVIWVSQETQMHAVTGISGSGPAYVFYLMNALQQAATEQGFSPEDARRLSLATFKGAVALAEQTGENFAVLQQNVTSKGGTTFEAIQTFNQHHVTRAIEAGVAACVARSQAITQQFSEQPHPIKPV